MGQMKSSIREHFSNKQYLKLPYMWSLNYWLLRIRWLLRIVQLLQLLLLLHPGIHAIRSDSLALNMKKSRNSIVDMYILDLNLNSPLLREFLCCNAWRRMRLCRMGQPIKGALVEGPRIKYQGCGSALV
jgi:hypothetical protein